MKTSNDKGRAPAPILIVEDDQAIRDLIASVLHTAGYATCEAGTGEQAIECARRERPLLVLIDIRLPGLSGFEVYRWLRDNIGASLPLIFVSGVRTEPFDRSAGLMLGADDYLVKPFESEELLGRVRSLLQRRPTMPLASKLTARELEVLRLLAEGHRQDDVARRLFISPKTVGTHIEHIYIKLGVQSRTQALALAYSERLIDWPAPHAPEDGGAIASESSGSAASSIATYRR